MKRVFFLSCVLFDEDVRLMERAANDEGHECRQQADQEHASPANYREKYWRDQRGKENSGLPSERET